MPDDPKGGGARALVLRNAFILLVAQAAAVPLSIIVNAVIARHLGAGDFGSLYLVTTFVTSGFLVIEWGQSGVLPAMVAQNRARAPLWLGSALTFRAAALFFVYFALAGACALLGYDREFQIILGLQFITAAISSVCLAYQDTARGFERTDVAAYALVSAQFGAAVFIVPALMLGGELRAVVIASACANAIVMLLVVRGVRALGVGALSVDRATLKRLATDGAPFFFFGLTMALQPNIDALLLSKLAPEETVGWHAAARKLVGVLVYPASALVTALYPTLCRLYTEDQAEFCRTARAAIETAALVAVPLAVGCGVYPDIGVAIFSKHAFGAAADNLQILSLFVLLLYLSMPLGSALLAQGRQRQWTAVLSMCSVVSVVLDPLLIPWFQRNNGNGGLGVSVSTVVSELLMVVSAVYLVPKGIFDGAFFRQSMRVASAGCVMAAVGYTRRWLTPWPSMPLAALAYVGSLRALGGLTDEQLRSLSQILPRRLLDKLGRKKPTTTPTNEPS